jgi:hypothetical protein
MLIILFGMKILNFYTYLKTINYTASTVKLIFYLNKNLCSTVRQQLDNETFYMHVQRL